MFTKDLLKNKDHQLTKLLLRYHNEANFSYSETIHKTMDSLFAERAKVRAAIAEFERMARKGA